MFEQYTDVFNISDLCSALKISKKTAYYLLNSGEIPYKKVGRHYKVRKSDVIEFLGDKK